MKQARKLARRLFKRKKRKVVWKIDPTKCMTWPEVEFLVEKLNERKDKNECNFREYFVICLGLFTGMRISEMKELVIDDVSFLTDFSEEVLNKTRKHPYSEPFILVRKGKGGKIRRVRINPDCVELLFEYLKWKINIAKESIERDVPLIYSKRNKGHYSRSGLYFMIKRTFKAVGKNYSRFSPHSLRHTYGAHLYRSSTKDVILVQKQMGHSSVKVTEVYIDIFNDDLTKALNHLYKYPKKEKR